MYYICKFSDTWSVYDASRQNSRNLEPAEISCLKSLFPGLLGENKILTALQVNIINPNKLLQLPVTDTKSNGKIKNPTELTSSK
jgi:hypothetical protein